MDEPIQVLAGTGGVALGEARTDHEGRKAILLHREGNPRELVALAETMGIEVIDVEYQKGTDDPRTYLAKADSKMLPMRFQLPLKATLGTA